MGPRFTSYSDRKAIGIVGAHRWLDRIVSEDVGKSSEIFSYAINCTENGTLPGEQGRGKGEEEERGKSARGERARGDCKKRRVQGVGRKKGAKCVYLSPSGLQ